LKILYVTAKGGIHDYRFLEKLVKDYDVLLLHYESDGLIPEIRSLPGLKIISKKPLYKALPLISELFHFKKVLKEFSPDILHTGYVWQVGILAAYSKFHPHLSMPWGSDVLTEPDKKFWIKKLVRKVFQTCDHIQCDAEFVREKIVNDYAVSPGKITVFPWGIDLSLFKPAGKQLCRKNLGIPGGKFVVLFTRALEEVYGINYLLEGFKDFAAGKDDVLLLMATDGSMKNYVLDYISSAGLESKFLYSGWVKNTDLPRYFGSADVYISTSLSDGTSLSLLEAMACGLGVIVTDVPAIKEWISDKNGIVAERKNTAGITAALEKYYKNRKLITEHGKKNVQIAAERADWDKNYNELKEIYAKLTPGKV